MIYEYQLRVLPQQAANEESLRDFIARDKGLDVRTIHQVRILRRASARSMSISLCGCLSTRCPPTPSFYRCTIRR